jgi:N-hydroxyarylamine O-acetyltransferase
MSSDSTFDLSAYFARIGYDGPRTATLETLRAIQLLHPQAIAFENLDPLLGRSPRLDIGSLRQKLVHSRRGGYCFEQNALFGHALRALGFRVTGLAGRVVWNRPDETPPPRSHMILRVEIDGVAWLADVGFGLSPTGPLLFEPNLEQQTPHEPFRLTTDGGQFTLQAKLLGKWQSFYRFDLQVQEEVDYEVANHYVSTWPTSHFVTSLIAARAAPGRRYGLRGNQLSIRPLSGAGEQRVLESAAEMRGALSDLFGIAVPEPERFDATVARLNLLAPA